MATYIPNASDSSQPTEDKYVYSAAQEFRAIKERINNVAASIGTGSAATGGLIVPNNVINNSTPNGRIDITDTNPILWNLGAGSMHLSCDLVFNNYFTANPGGHLGIVLRCDMDVINNAVRGNGMALGNLVTAPNGTQINPGAQLESWAEDLGFPMGDNNLIIGAETNKPLIDNQRYRVLVDSVVAQTTERRFRFAIYRWVPADAEFELECDTGYVYDTNYHFDHTKSGLVFGHVFASNLATWSIDVQNIRVTWGPAPTDMPATTDRLSKSGGTITGDLVIDGDLTVTGSGGGGGGGLVEPVTFTQQVTMSGTGAAIRVKNDSLSYADWTAIQSYQLNGATTLLLKPNGSGNASTLIAANSSALAGAFGGIKVGMDGSNATLQTLNVNLAPVPPLDIKIGTTLVAAINQALVAFNVPVTATTLTLSGASEAIGSSVSFAAANSQNGVQANTFVNTSPINFEYSSTNGSISTDLNAYFPGAFTLQQRTALDVLIRPLWCYMSVILGELQNRKVL